MAKLFYFENRSVFNINALYIAKFEFQNNLGIKLMR